MANNNYISRSKFQEIFAKALSKCNIPQDEQDKFFKEGSTLQLRNLGICIAITVLAISAFMRISKDKNATSDSI